MIRTSTGTLVRTATAAALVGLLVLGAAGRIPAGGAPGDLKSAGAAVAPGQGAVNQVPGVRSGDSGAYRDDTSQTGIDGDDVSPALATYGIDHEGNLFEVHSPDTEVPRLTGPRI